MIVAEPGYATTEFWIALVISFIGLLEVFGIVHITDGQKQAVIGFLTMLAPVLIYIVSRAIRKFGTTTTVAKTSQQQLPAVSAEAPAATAGIPVPSKIPPGGYGTTFPPPVNPIVPTR